MKRLIILSNQQIVTLLEQLGYEPQIQEEVQFKCSEDHQIEPIIVYTVSFKLPAINPVIPPLTRLLIHPNINLN